MMEILKRSFASTTYLLRYPFLLIGILWGALAIYALVIGAFAYFIMYGFYAGVHAWIFIHATKYWFPTALKKGEDEQAD